MAVKFSKATLNNLEVRDKPYEVYDSKITGLFIRVYASGRKKYMVAINGSSGGRRIRA